MTAEALDRIKDATGNNGLKPIKVKPVKTKPAATIRFDLPEEWGAYHLTAALKADYGAMLEVDTVSYRKADGRLVIEGQPVTK